jgi:lauroyl/myristoyl acyltransferase
MEVGSIGFHDGSKVKSMLVVKDKEIIKRIEKTKEVCLHLTYIHLFTFDIVTDYMSKVSITNYILYNYRKNFQILLSYKKKERGSSEKS